MPGLVTEPSGDAVTHDPAGEGEPEFTTQGVGASAESHLDSFIESSGWTREDLLVVMGMAQTLILLYWLHVEVNR